MSSLQAPVIALLLLDPVAALLAPGWSGALTGILRTPEKP